MAIAKKLHTHLLDQAAQSALSDAVELESWAFDAIEMAPTQQAAWDVLALSATETGEPRNCLEIGYPNPTVRK